MLGRLALRAFARRTGFSAAKPPKPAPAPPPDPPKARMQVGKAAREQFMQDEFPKELKTAGLSRKDVDPDFLNYVIST